MSSALRVFCILRLFRSLMSLIFILVLLALLLHPAQRALADTSDEIQAGLICQCGCTMVVADCECDTANAMRDGISEFIAQGMTKDEILAAFVAQYGETVLAEPTKKGFNLAAWILPISALVAGAGLIAILLTFWIRARKGREAALAREGHSSPQRRMLEERLKKDLEEYKKSQI